ncbi:MAG: FtsQ-type POTRA domain-containing protein [Eubacteriales bacterium]|nr:FtsQ-type POTRA domain-containing protein [Eubacteriales bacterium]MDD4462313.1 FtsQ-type POTRA domain-containing protein [Eubacteriales bacterium]
MKQPRRKFRHHLTRLSLMLLVLIAVSLLIWQLPPLRLHTMEVSGLRRLSEAEIIESSGLTSGQHLFHGLGGSLTHLRQLRYQSVEAAVAALPEVESCRVTLHYPGQIDLEVAERVEVAYLAIPDGSVMIDKEGVAIRIWREVPEDIPLIEGVHLTSLQLGAPLTAHVPAALNSAITMMGAIIEADRDSRTPQQLLSSVKSIRPLGHQRIYLTLVLPKTAQEVTVLAEISQQLSEDMIWLRFAIEQGVLENRGKGILDLTGGRKTFKPD